MVEAEEVTDVAEDVMGDAALFGACCCAQRGVFWTRSTPCGEFVTATPCPAVVEVVAEEAPLL